MWVLRAVPLLDYKGVSQLLCGLFFLFKITLLLLFFELFHQIHNSIVDLGPFLMPSLPKKIVTTGAQYPEAPGIITSTGIQTVPIPL